jgi:hypothetical protein
MKKIHTVISIVLFVLLGLNLNSCKKEASNTSSYPYSVRLTDATGPYSAVNIDLQGVEVTGIDGKAVSLNVHAGIVNVLRFSNGLDTLITTGTLEVATVEQIRLILGTNNSVVINNVKYPLSTPSADQSGLKLQVHQTLEAGVQYSVLLDFDANKSIVLDGNGTYRMKPVIRTVEVALNGSIRGKISPIGILATVVASSGDNSYSSTVNATGDFMLMGLPAGTYSITVTPALPLLPVTKSSILVATGVTTSIGVIAL